MSRSLPISLVQQDAIMNAVKIIPTWNYTTSIPSGQEARIYVYGCNKIGETLVAVAKLTGVSSSNKLTDCKSAIFSYALQSDFLAIRWELRLVNDPAKGDLVPFNATLIFGALHEMKVIVGVSPLNNAFSPTLINSSLT